MACNIGTTPELVSEDSVQSPYLAAAAQEKRQNQITAYRCMAEVFFYEGNDEEARRYLELLDGMHGARGYSLVKYTNPMMKDEAKKILRDMRAVQVQIFQRVMSNYKYFPLHHCTKVDWGFVMKYVDFEPIKYLALAEENYEKQNLDEARQNLARAKDPELWSDYDEKDQKPVKYTKRQIVEDATDSVKFTGNSLNQEEYEKKIKIYTEAATAAEIINDFKIKERYAIKAALLRNELAILKARLIQEENNSDEHKENYKEIEEIVEKVMEHECDITRKTTEFNTKACQAATEPGMRKDHGGSSTIEENYVDTKYSENKAQIEMTTAYLTLAQAFFCDNNIGETQRFLVILKAMDSTRSFKSQIERIEKQIEDAAEIRTNLVLCQEQIFDRMTKKHKYFPMYFCVKVDWDIVSKYVDFTPVKVFALTEAIYAKRDFRLAQKYLYYASSLPLWYESVLGSKFYNFKNKEPSVPVKANEGPSVAIKDNDSIDVHLNDSEGPSVAVNDNDGIVIPVEDNKEPFAPVKHIREPNVIIEVEDTKETSLPVKDNQRPANDISGPSVHVINNKEPVSPKDKEVSYVTLQKNAEKEIKSHIISAIFANAAKTEDEEYSNLTEEQLQKAKEMYSRAASYAGIIGEKELREQFAEKANIIKCVLSKQNFCSLWDMELESRQKAEAEKEFELENRPVKTPKCVIQ